MFHEVWENNFEEEFEGLLNAVNSAGGSEAIVAMDMEFPGFPCNDPQFSPPAVHHQALRCNVDQLWPVQLGVAIMSTTGQQYGVWTFNLRFDPDVDAHTDESLTFLRNAGLDLPRHRREGIAALTLGCKLAHSNLLGLHGHAPSWLTFSGSYDWAYLLKLVTLGQPLPVVTSAYEKALSVHCPKRHELRDFLSSGSLEALGRRHGVKRHGHAHTAGSDALLTAELFRMCAGTSLHLSAPIKSDSFQQQGSDSFQQHGSWSETSSEHSWQNEEGWFSDSSDEWYSGANESSPANWVSAGWAPWGQDTTSWYSPQMKQFSDPAWYTSDFQSWVIAR